MYSISGVFKSALPRIIGKNPRVKSSETRVYFACTNPIPIIAVGLMNTCTSDKVKISNEGHTAARRLPSKPSSTHQLAENLLQGMNVKSALKTSPAVL
eukprot:jgi/Botrbrau1/14430/Bobra.0014s0076.1